MGTREILFIISLSISFPLITCAIIYQKIDRERFPIYPIFICTALGLLLEVCSFTLGESYSFIILLNIYILIEFILMRIQFYFWTKHFNSNFPIKSVVGAVIIWGICVFILENIGQRNLQFIIIYSFALIITGINVMNKLIFSNKSLTKNFLLLFCVSIIVTYTVAIIVEFFCNYNKVFTVNFIINVFYIKSILNALSNLMIAIALLCIPKKQQYTLSF